MLSSPSSPTLSDSSIDSVTMSEIQRLFRQLQGLTGSESDREESRVSHSHGSSFTSDWSSDSNHSSHHSILRSLDVPQISQTPQGAILPTEAELQRLVANLGNEPERNLENSSFPDSDSISWDNGDVSRSISNPSLSGIASLENIYEASELAEANVAIVSQQFAEARAQLEVINVSSKPLSYQMLYHLLLARAYKGLGLNEQAGEAYDNASSCIRAIVASSVASEVGESERAESPAPENTEASLTRALEQIFETKHTPHPRGYRA